eukprot:gene31308-6455_t
MSNDSVACSDGQNIIEIEDWGLGGLVLQTHAFSLCLFNCVSFCKYLSAHDEANLYTIPRGLGVLFIGFIFITILWNLLDEKATQYFASHDQRGLHVIFLAVKEELLALGMLSLLLTGLKGVRQQC